MLGNPIGRRRGFLQRELMRAVLERIQGVSMKAMIEEEAEIHDPKAVYEVEELLNNPYMNRAEVPLAMDIFKPVVPEEQELPVIVTIHGGGLVVGDRTISRLHARVLAQRGYLVFSIEYRLAPRANSAEQLDDVCAGMDLIGRRLVDFNVDFTRMYLTAESAGAYLAIYVAAMKESKALQEAIGYAPTRMTFKAIGLISGMLYTTRPDPIGWLLSDQFFGDKRTDPVFLRYMDPEHPEIVGNLPPVFLITSRGDFLNNYSLMYHKALKQAGRASHLIYYGEKELGHAFVTMHPELPQSLDALDRMTAWFEEKADQAREKAIAKTRTESANKPKTKTRTTKQTRTRAEPAKKPRTTRTRRKKSNETPESTVNVPEDDALRPQEPAAEAPQEPAAETPQEPAEVAPQEPAADAPQEPAEEAPQNQDA